MRKIVTTILVGVLALAGSTAFAQNIAVEAGFGLSSTRFNYTLGSTTADLYGGIHRRYLHDISFKSLNAGKDILLL